MVTFFSTVQRFIDDTYMYIFIRMSKMTFLLFNLSLSSINSVFFKWYKVHFQLLDDLFLKELYRSKKYAYPMTVNKDSKGEGAAEA